MNEFLKTIIGSIWAGIAISIGGIAFLVTKQAIFFPIGLLIVCVYHLNLFTGKVPYAEVSHIPKLMTIVIGNIIGAFLVGFIISYSKPSLTSVATEICEKKLIERWEIIPLAILCNILIFVAVDNFKNHQISLTYRVIVLWMSTTLFVVCGFEHCVANAFYFGVARIINWNVLIFLISNIIFNAVGGIIAFRSFSYLKKE